MTVARSMPADLGVVDITAPEPSSKLFEGYNIWKMNVLAELQQTEIYKIIRTLLADAAYPRAISPEGLALVMLSLPSHVFSALQPAVKEQTLNARVLDHLPQQLRGEVIRLRESNILLSHKCRRKAAQEVKK